MMIKGGKIVKNWQMPVRDGFEVDVEKLNEIVAEVKEREAIVFVEEMKPFTNEKKRTSPQAAYSMGRAREQAELPFRLAGLQVDLVQPKFWKKELGVNRDDGTDIKKGKLATYLSGWVPGHRLSDGEVDAGLIAVAGQRELRKNNPKC